VLAGHAHVAAAESAQRRIALGRVLLAIRVIRACDHHLPPAERGVVVTAARRHERAAHIALSGRARAAPAGGAQWLDPDRRPGAVAHEPVSVDRQHSLLDRGAAAQERQERHVPHDRRALAGEGEVHGLLRALAPSLALLAKRGQDDVALAAQHRLQLAAQNRGDVLGHHR
jgi:hypothetical protein